MLEKNPCPSLSPCSNILCAGCVLPNFFLLMSPRKRAVRWKCEHEKTCSNNNACRQKKLRDKKASEAAAAAISVDPISDTEMTARLLAVAATAAAVVASIGIAALWKLARAKVTPVKPGRQISLFQSFGTPSPAKAPPRHLSLDNFLSSLL